MPPECSPGEGHGSGPRRPALFDSEQLTNQKPGSRALLRKGCAGREVWLSHGGWEGGQETGDSHVRRGVIWEVYKILDAQAESHSGNIRISTSRIRGL